MKFYIIHAFFFQTPEYCSNLGTLCMIGFILSSCFPLEKKHVIIVLYFILFADLLIRANLKKRNTDVVPGSGSSGTSFPGCLFSFSSGTKGFSVQTVVTPNTFVIPRAHKHTIFPSEGQCGHLEAENNSGQQRVLMQVVTPPPVQRGALNQANTQLHTLQFSNFCFTSLHVSSFHHLQGFQDYICS